MRKTGILNPALAARINRLGHTHTFAIADCGLPIPTDVPVVDLALVFGIPRFSETLQVILAEVVVERATIAHETPEDVRRLLPDVPVDTVCHEEFKSMLLAASFIVRTGEATPFANVILHSGVAF